MNDDTLKYGVGLLGSYLDCTASALEAALNRQQSLAGQGEYVLLGAILLEFGSIDRETLLTAVRTQRADQLKACPLFRRLSRRHLLELASSFENISFDSGQAFIQQDTVDEYLYEVCGGSVLVFRTDEYGEDVPLSTLHPGEPLGEMGYFSDGLRSASAKALQRAHLIRIHYAELSRCMDSYPKLANSFLHLVTERLRRTNLAFEENVQRRLTAERSLRNLNEFLDLSEVLELRLGIEGLIERVVHTASRLMEAERATLFLIDPLSGDLWSKVAEGEEVREIRVPRGAGIVGWVASSHATLNIQDAYEDERFNPEVDRKTGYRTRTILCGPVFSLKGEVIGVIQVINKKQGCFLAEDETLFRAFAHQAAVSIENFNLYRKVISSHEKMAMLLDIATSVTQTLELPRLIRSIVTRIPEILSCDRSAFFMLDRETHELWSVEAHGSGLKEIRFPASAGLAGYAATHGEVLNIADAYEDVRFNPDIDRQTGYRTRTVLCMPIQNRDGMVIGVAQAINKSDGVFGHEEIDLLRAVSAQIAVALENARLYADTVNIKNYLENIQESISNGILSLDENYLLRTANRSAQRLLNSALDQLQGQDLRRTLGQANGFLSPLLERVFTSGESALQLDRDLVVQDGTRSINLNVVPLSGDEGERTGLVLVMDDITREKRARGTLGRYMPKDIVDRLMQDTESQKLGGVRSTATILFNDIRNFTTLSESLGAEETMNFLNEYFTLMVDEVFRQKGLLDKFIGDAMMAVFGVPYAQDDDACRAVRTALNMMAALRSFNGRRLERGLSVIDIGIGINTGEVISGNMGSEKRMDYTVIGDGVNISSRLEGLNKHYGTHLLVSESTRLALADNFVLLHMDKVLLKGKTQPTNIYEVIGEAGYQPSAAEQCFSQGIALYNQRMFSEALNWFARHEDSDERCRIFSARCRQFEQVSPPEDWDGVWRVTVK